MRVIIADRNKAAHEAFRSQFQGLPEVEMYLGPFESIEDFDCMTTAGNSFGLMDAGIDLAVVRFFGRPLMELIQKRILEDFLGEQLVGTSIIVPTGDAKHPFVAHTPTMRVPMNVSKTDNVYLATWATLLAVHRHNAVSDRTIETLVIPGLGTGSGGVAYEEAALQMRLACEFYLNRPKYINPSMAHHRQERIHYGGRSGFERPR